MSTGEKARSGRRIPKKLATIAGSALDQTEIAQRGTIVKKEEAPTGGRGLFGFLWGEP
jgi:hypothetical protein